MAISFPSMGTCVLPMTSDVNAIETMTMKVSKGLAFPVLALPGVWHISAPSEN